MCLWAGVAPDLNPTLIFRGVLLSCHDCMCIIGGFKWANNLQYSSVNNSLNNSHFTSPMSAWVTNSLVNTIWRCSRMWFFQYSDVDVVNSSTVSLSRMDTGAQPEWAAWGKQIGREAQLPGHQDCTSFQITLVILISDAMQGTVSAKRSPKYWGTEGKNHQCVSRDCTKSLGDCTECIWKAAPAQGVAHVQVVCSFLFEADLSQSSQWCRIRVCSSLQS